MDHNHIHRFVCRKLPELRMHPVGRTGLTPASSAEANGRRNGK
jgi:hypothetical protein